MFSKKSADRPAMRSDGRQTFSVLGPDLTITGNIAAASDLHIDGTVDGDIACATLVQGESGVINGAVVAQSARLAGRVTGSIAARELVILKTARIAGDVEYDALTIEQGAEVEGRFARREDKPAPLHSPPELAIAG